MQGAPKFGKVELLLKDKDNGLARNKVIKHTHYNK